MSAGLPDQGYWGCKAMISEKYDLIVIGAGPGGSVTSRFAAENGASVLMLERDREPGIPVRCAEGVSHSGISPFIEIEDRWISAKIDIAILNSPDGNSATMYNNGAGYVLERRIFDAALCELACKKGVTLLTKANAIGLIKNNNKIEGVIFRYLGKTYKVRSKLVVGADGVESRVGRWAGINTTVKLEDIDTCAQFTLTDISVKKNACEFYFGVDIAPGGYIWIFPKSDHSANIGIGISGHLAKEKSPYEYLCEFVSKKYPQGKTIYTVFGSVTTSATLKEIVSDNLMLVGDAARQVNPITGGGIVHAMIAGKIAGTVAAEAIKNNDFRKHFLKKYQRQWDKKLGNIQKTMFNLKNRFLRMNDEKFNRIVAFCQKIPRNEFSLKVLFAEAVKGDPKLMLEVAKAFVVSKIK